MKKNEIKVTVITYNKTCNLISEKGTRLKDLFDESGIHYSLPCGGSGRCGACRIRFIEGAPAAAGEERAALTAGEISLGYRLLCRCRLEGDAVISLTGSASDEKMLIETGTTSDNAEKAGDFSAGLGIAIDLGTTTIAAALIRASGGTDDVDISKSYEVLRTASCVNSQRRYGNDVISRIAAAEDGEAAKELQRLVINDLEALIRELIEEPIADPIANPMEETLPQSPIIRAVTIAGNTTMLHLLRGMDVSGLGRYPYTPYSTAMEKLDSGSVLGGTEGARLTLLPGISAFVGADIVAGLFTLDKDREEKYFFLDLGTNGEMAFYDGETLKVTSAAAGPVFEAGGISCGVAGIPGAINHVEIDETTHRVKLRTIQVPGTSKQQPIGICGTAVCEMASELARCGIMDETGLLSDEYFDEGFPVTEDGRIRFTQQDIRSLQLAKAAIFTGTKALLEGRVPDRVIIAGGFGTNIFPEKIARLRMFPEGFNGKIVAAGNTSLQGAAMYTAAVLTGRSSEAAADARLQRITDMARTVELAASDSFDEAYLEAMNF